MNGTPFWRVVEGDVVTQNNAGCFFAGHGGKDGEETFGHELGHGLGIGHSCGDANSPPCTDPVLSAALMRAFVHGDGRGAQLGADDRAAALFLYGFIFADGFESGNTGAWSATVP